MESIVPDRRIHINSGVVRIDRAAVGNPAGKARSINLNGGVVRRRDRAAVGKAAGERGNVDIDGSVGVRIDAAGIVDAAEQRRCVNFDCRVAGNHRAAVGDAAREGRRPIDINPGLARRNGPGIADTAGEKSSADRNSDQGRGTDRACGVDLDPAADIAGVENLAFDRAAGNRQRAGDRPGIANVAGEGRVGNIDRRSDAGIGVRERSRIGHDKPPARVERHLTQRLTERGYLSTSFFRTSSPLHNPGSTRVPAAVEIPQLRVANCSLFVTPLSTRGYGRYQLWP